MIEAGDRIENPRGGERLVFRTTARESGGRAVVFELFLPAGATPPLHAHAADERVEIIAGRVCARVGERTLRASPGDRLTIPAGSPHRLANAGEEPAHVVCEIRPALPCEELVEAIFSDQAVEPGSTAPRRGGCEAAAGARS